MMRITVAGNIGAGKSTLCRLLSEQLAADLYLEADGDRNPYLQLYYQDPHKWAYKSQQYFLHDMLAQEQQIAAKGQLAIQDRCSYEAVHIFQKLLVNQKVLSQDEHAQLSSLLQKTTVPDLLLYLQVPVDLLQQRIKLRGRSYEQQISADYLQSIDHLYQDLINNWTQSQLLVIPVDAEFDVVTEQQGIADSVRKILSL